MSGTRRTRERIVESGIIAVLREIEVDRIAPVARAIHEAGVDAIEVTANDPRVYEKVATVDETLADTDAIIGAGTVLDGATAQSVIDAGAEFVLAPDVNSEVITTCNRHGILAIPGVMTPTEAVTAMEAGADMLKLFPATTVGPSHISALQGPLGDVPIVPTGGVNLNNVEAFFKEGAAGVGVGSSLVNYDAIERNDMREVKQTAAKFVEAVNEA